MATLTKLSAEQEEKIPLIRDEFLGHGLSIEPADFDVAEQAARDAYAVAGLPAPKIFIRLRSPLEGAYGAAILKGTRFDNGNKVRDQVRAQVRDQVRAQVRAQVWAQVMDQVWDQVMDQVWDQVMDQVGDQVRAQVWAQVRDQVWDQVWDQVMDQVWDQVRAAFFSQHEAGWLSWATFFHRVCKIPGTEKIEPLARIAASCGWVWFFSGAAIITDRPARLKRDDRNQLHCEDGPAIEYRDGFAIYAWHGTRIPSEWITDKSTLSAKVALTWANIEQRRAALEIVGWHNVLRELKAKVIDEHPDPSCGTLVEVKLPDLERKARFIRAQCGTKREFAIGVPPEIETVAEGQAWLTGLPLEKFSFPSIRT